MVTVNSSCKKMTIVALVIMAILSFVNPVIGDNIGTFQKIDPNKIPDVLAMLAATTYENYEKIKTLKGQVSFEDMIIYRGVYAADRLKQKAGITIKEPNKLADISEGISEFKLDLKKNILFKNVKWPNPDNFIDFNSNAIYPSLSGAKERTNIITNEYELESYPYTMEKDGTVLSRIAEKRKLNKSGIIKDESDPRICFAIGRPVWELLSQFSSGLRNYYRGDVNVFYDVVLEKKQTAKGSSYRVQLKNPGATQPFEVFVLDGEKGFNPTYIEVINDNGVKISEITTDFNEINGIFLPIQRQVLQYDGNDGLLRRQSDSTFRDLQVNISFPENTFSINNLGLKNGEKFVDKIAGKEYKYQDANFVPIAEPNNLPEPNNPPK